MTRSAPDPDRPDLIEHPGWCSRAVCDLDPGGDIVHRQIPSGPIVSLDRQHITLALIRVDEHGDGGRQVVHVPEGLMTLGTESAVIDLDGAKAIRDAAAALVEELRPVGLLSSEAS